MQVEFIINSYKVQSTGADGGHNYILANVKYDNKERRLLITFANRSDELNLRENIQIKVKGELVDEGENLDLSLINSIIQK